MSDVKGLYIDEHVVRIVAALVSVITIVLLFTGWEWLAVLLTVDFALRAFTRLPSPLAWAAKAVAKQAHWPPKPIFAPPKKFAAAVGSVFSILIFLFLHFQLITLYYITAFILLACAVLESVFKICLGCYMYNWIVIPFVNLSQKNRQHS
ncbi:protein of unknown function [Filimonas lacunae]|uniref:DUF4395 domain-containing protein n=1 Tax=Filimonas lacunae TaxID=477680 RepID=A0A1N7QXW7_9BACT|nr:DUF4395 domain-containing protein [Filimonas lacunae]SIT27712.1 protein of unknown function [Filimonas lacunae]